MISNICCLLWAWREMWKPSLYMRWTEERWTRIATMMMIDYVTICLHMVLRKPFSTPSSPPRYGLIIAFLLLFSQSYTCSYPILAFKYLVFLSMRFFSFTMFLMIFFRVSRNQLKLWFLETHYYLVKVNKFPKGNWKKKDIIKTK